MNKNQYTVKTEVENPPRQKISQRTIIEFSENDRLSLLTEALLDEFTPDDPEKIDSFWDLLDYLDCEKNRILKILLTADNQETRTMAWSQLDEVRKDISLCQIFIERHIKTEQEQ